MDIIRELREGEFDILVGVNLLREGLDLPEVSLVAVLAVLTWAVDWSVVRRIRRLNRDLREVADGQPRG